MKVLSFGEILLRLASPGYTKLFQKDSLDATFCGGEANVAVSLANFGVQSEFLTVVPKGKWEVEFTGIATAANGDMYSVVDGATLAFSVTK